MSAYVVSTEHIRAIITAGLNGRGHLGELRWTVPGMNPTTQARALHAASAETTGAMLLAENIRSVNHRYVEDELEPVYQHHIDTTPREPLEILKLIRSYEYQSCESADWEQSEAFEFCRALTARMICQLPGYDELPWAI